MRQRLCELIVCPTCGGGLTATARVMDGDEIMNGELACTSCTSLYPIEAGIPRFEPNSEFRSDDARRTVDRFGDQWQEFDRLSDVYEKQFLRWIAPNDAALFRDKIVLDGGCGKGRHSALVARFGARDVIAVDLSDAVLTAYRNTRAFPNIHVVKADLFRLPLKPETIDLVFSVGVLHHTADPKRAFGELVRYLKPGGKILAWVYGQENNAWIERFIDPVRKSLTSRLPHRWLYELAKLPAAIVYLASHGIYGPLSQPPLKALGERLFYQKYLSTLARFPFTEIHAIVHDHLTPAIAHYVSRADFLGWFRDAGLEDVRIIECNGNSWSGSGTNPQRVGRNLGEVKANSISSKLSHSG